MDQPYRIPFARIQTASPLAGTANLEHNNARFNH